MRNPNPSTARPLLSISSHRIFLATSLAILVVFGASIQAEEIAQKKFLQHSKVIGAEKCIECHESEVKAWKESVHFLNKDLHKNEKAGEIARKMGITSVAKIRESALCVQCHFTVQKPGNAPAKVISGVSCESCHGGAKDWLDLHNTGDRREADDTTAEQAKRVAKAHEHGMIQPTELGELAANCYSCHIVTDEKLINIGGHPVGSTNFELSSWMLGEVRHNFFDSKGKTNAAIKPERRRMLYLVGNLLEMEYSMRGLARAKEKADYGKAMGQRCVSTRKDLQKVAETLGAACPPEVTKAIEIVSAPGLLKFFNVDPLVAAADALEKQIESLVANHDGTAFPALDALLPKEGKGAVHQP